MPLQFMFYRNYDIGLCIDSKLKSETRGQSQLLRRTDPNPCRSEGFFGQRRTDLKFQTTLVQLLEMNHSNINLRENRPAPVYKC